MCGCVRESVCVCVHVSVCTHKHCVCVFSYQDGLSWHLRALYCKCIRIDAAERRYLLKVGHRLLTVCLSTGQCLLQSQHHAL